MVKKSLNRRSFVIMLGICFVAFALRTWNISSTNYDLDEAWTYSNIVYAQDADTFDQIYREPNNTFHIMMTLPLASAAWSKLGFRFWSIAAGMLTVAAIGRLGFRLYGRRGAWASAWVAALALGSVDYSQHVRPYALAFLFATLATVAYVERNKRWNMLLSSLVPLLHIGAFPIVMLQDAQTVWRILRGKYVNRVDWVVRRTPPYVMLLLILYLVYLRRLSGKVISSGQATPSPMDVLEHWCSTVVGDSTLSLGLFGLVAIFVAGVIGLHWRRDEQSDVLPKLAIPLLWIAITYGVLVTMTIISDGPIKYVHITHVAFATALLVGAGVSVAPRIGGIIIIGLITVAAAIGLQEYYAAPYDNFTETFIELEQWRDEQTIYFEAIFPVQALALGAPEDADLEFLVFIDNVDRLPESYFLLQYKDFDPLPNNCNADAIWRYGAFHLHECTN